MTREKGAGSISRHGYLRRWENGIRIHHVRAHYHRQCDRKYQRTMREKRKTK